MSISLAPFLGVWALVAGTIAGPLAYLIASYILAPYRPRLSLDRQAGQTLINYGRWVFLTSLVVMAGQSTLKLVISRELEAGELGLYYLATSIAFLPADVTSQIVGEVSFPLYARLQSDLGEASKAFRSVLSTLLAVLVPTLTILIVLAPCLVDKVLGAKWGGSAPVIRVLAVETVIGLLGEAIGPLLQGIGRPDRTLVIESIQSFMLIIVAMTLAPRFGIVGAAAAWVPAVTASQLIGVAYLRRTLRHPFAGFGRRIVTLAAISIVVALAATATLTVIPGQVGIIAAALLGGLLSATLLWQIEQRFAVGFSDGLVMAFPAIGAVFRLPKEAGAEFGSSNV